MDKSRLFLMIALACGAMTPGGAFSQGSLPEQAEQAPRITPEAVVTSACPVNRMTTASSNEIGTETSSTNFVDVPGMQATVNIPVPTNCVGVEYTATVFAGGNEVVYVQATMDGVPCSPANVRFPEEDGDVPQASIRAFDFKCQNVRPGAHTFKIQWRSFFGGPVYRTEGSQSATSGQM